MERDRPTQTLNPSNPLTELIGSIPREDVDALAKYWSNRRREPWGMGANPAVLVVDMTRGFVEDSYPTGWAATGEPCASAILRLLEVARDTNLPVFFTRGITPSTPVERGAWLRGQEALSTDPSEHEIVDKLKPLPGESVLLKPKPSAFFGTQLMSMLNYMGVDTIIVTGMVTSGCVRATVNDAFALNYRVIVPMECVADRSQISHNIELIDMGVKYADLVYVSDLIKDLRGRVSHTEDSGAEGVNHSVH